MQVTAVATPCLPGWRWRILSNAGEVIVESHQLYPSIAAALAKDRASTPSPWISPGADDEVAESGHPVDIEDDIERNPPVKGGPTGISAGGSDQIVTAGQGV
jgi:hypothetical protein